MRWLVALGALGALARVALAREVELRTEDERCLVLAPWSPEARELRRQAAALAAEAA